MLVDTHAHLNFPAFDKDRNKIIEKCLENDLWLINIGSNYETSKKAVEIAQNYPEGVYASIGLHPINLDTGLVKIRMDESEGSHFEKEFDYEKYRELVLSAGSGRVVAIGEIGLDYYWKPKTKRKLELFKEKQRTGLCQQLDLAKELNLPVIFHCRMAHQDLLEILNFQFSISNFQIRSVMHGFVGTIAQLKEYLKMGFYIGLNGIIFKKIEGINLEENIKATPIEKILIETDCPYLTPPLARRSFREGGQNQEERNEPINIKYVAEKIAQIKNLNFDKVAEITTKNAKELFKLE
jgi:TatD DNase family protein